MLKNKLWVWEVDGTSEGTWPVPSFGIHNTES